MCGISGIYALDHQPVGQAEILAQIGTLIHRGPDQGATYLSPQGSCGLGIRRLSIIDVAGGHQPLHNEAGTVHLVYNGETYNHRALRAELEALGHRPRSHSDGEVIVHGYETWGAAGIIGRLRGMAAFALWDEARQQLFLGRDRFGIKPLYYATHAGRLYFASEIKAILAEPSFPRGVNLAALQAMLTLGFVPGPATMFEGIYKLPPAHFLLAKAGTLQIEPYWQLQYRPDKPLSEREAAEQFRALLQEAVELRLMSEVPLGALLSGGLDSGTIVAFIQRLLSGAGNNSRLKTVSIGFDQPDYDESPLARQLADHVGTEHHTLQCTPQAFEDYPVVMGHLEEPQCSATALPVYQLYRACRQAGLTVVLTGEGSDELLGGYHWHQGDARVRSLLALPQPARRLLAASPLPMSIPARRVLGRAVEDLGLRYQGWLEVEGETYRQRLFTSDVSATLNHNGGNPLLAGWRDKLPDLGQSASPFHQLLWLESRTRLVDFINFEVDKMSMAHSIEARVPFLDHKLWEFCAGLPAGYKLKGRTEKYLLRQAARGLLPEATRTRRKKGLAAPYAAWLRTERLPEWAEAVLSPSALKEAGLFQVETVQALRQAHRAGQPHLGPLFMGVLGTQLWFSLFITNNHTLKNNNDAIRLAR